MTRSTRLLSIQALRGVAAFAVVLYHASRHVDQAFTAPDLIRLFRSGHAGVDLFFIISGFIIAFVHHRDVGAPGRVTDYLVRRLTRVFPLYWIALALTVAMDLAGGHMAPTLPSLLWNALMLPTVEEPILGIAWTLQFELVFYAAFAALICSRTAGLVVILSWLMWIVVANSGLVDPGGIAVPLWGFYSVEFFLGMVVAQALRSTRVPMPRVLAAAGGVLFLAAMTLESVDILPGYGVAARLAYGGAAGLLVLGLTAAEQAGQLTTPKWLEVLGEASYSIYLFHFVFVGTAWQFLLKSGADRHVSAIIAFLFLAGAALVGGLVTARFVERPLLRMMRTKPTPAAMQVV